MRTDLDPSLLQPGEGAGGGEPAPAAKPWVLVSLGCGRRQFEVTEFQRSQEGAAQMAAARGGVEARILVAENDRDLQIRQIMDAVLLPEGRRPVAVVAYTAAVEGYEQVARVALEAGIGWVLVDSQMSLDPLRGEFPDALVSSVSADSVEVGRLSARLALALLPRGGEAVVIEGPSGTSTALQRLQGLQEGLGGSQLRIGNTLVADWKTAGAEKVTESWLERAGDSLVRPDLIISQNDEMAVGMLRVLRERKPSWGKVPAIGIDGLPDHGQRLVREGVLSATILNPSPTGPGVDLVVRWLRGEKVGPITIPVRPYPAIEELAPLPRA
jgi:ABC-type sugar transport system substrate-binding protein